MRRSQTGQRKTKRQSARRMNRGKTGTKSRRLLYRDRTTGRFVSKSTWKRSRAQGGSRYIGERRYSADLNILGFDGYVPVVVRSFKKAQFASKHLIAVARFLRTGDTKLLKPFVGKRIGGVELLTDPGRLQILADADLVKLDGLYRHNRGQGQRE